VGDAICDFAGTKTVKECNVLSEDSLEVFSDIRGGGSGMYSLMRRLMRSPLTIQHTIAMYVVINTPIPM
jgi:hypothetical protein